MKSYLTPIICSEEQALQHLSEKTKKTFPTLNEYTENTSLNVSIYKREGDEMTLGVKRIRELQHEIQGKPYDGIIYICIIDFHLATTEAMNAFLKTLEEPPDHIQFLLIVEAIDSLLDTVLSRCIVLWEARRSMISSELSDLVLPYLEDGDPRFLEALYSYSPSRWEGEELLMKARSAKTLKNDMGLVILSALEEIRHTNEPVKNIIERVFLGYEHTPNGIINNGSIKA